jgi:REP element-mobilizing transposase RayT
MADGWYHVTARGIERRVIFTDARDHQHFEDLLAETVERFHVVIHAHVQLASHYHLIVQTPEANLSRAIQWLNVSYVVWFNRRHGRVGPLMQGRFKSILVEGAAWAYELSLYVHLNPVMRRSLGLDKTGKRAESQGLRVPSREEVSARLRGLREYRWSSYRAYAGYAKPPAWLATQEILSRAATVANKRVAQYRKDVQGRLSKGVDPDRAEQARAAFALGTEAFRDRIRTLAKPGREIAVPAGLRRRVAWAELVALAEEVTGERLDPLRKQRGSIGRPLLLWAARRYAGMTLREAGEAAGGMDYTAVAMAVKRLEQRAANNSGISRLMRAMQAKCAT